MKIRSTLLAFLIMFCCAKELTAQCNNVLVNGDASAGVSGWNFSTGAGANWLLQNWGYGNAWVASYNWTTMNQTVDLYSSGYTSQYLDQQPQVSFSQMFKGKHNYYNDHYYYKIELFNGSNQLMDSFTYGSQSTPISTTINWDTIAGSFTSYGTGLRYVRVEFGGKSVEFWSGNFGTIVDNSVVSIAETIDTTVCGGSFTFNNQTLTTPGTYTANFSGVYGCDSTVILNLQFDSISLDYDFDEPTCFGYSNGSGIVHASGGTSPYTFSWSSGGNDSLATNLSSGSHSCTVTDVNGCTDTATFSILEPDELILSITLDSNASCYDAADGGASATAIGGTPGYTYDWSNAASGEHITDIAPSEYFVTVTDSNGCADTSTIVVGVFDDIAPVALVRDVSIYLNESGLASVDVGDIDSASFDNCGIDTMSISLSDFDCSDVGENIIEFTITDSNSNSDSAFVTVTVVDTIKPLLSCLSDTAICETTFSFPFPTATDNCGVATIVQTSGLPSGSTFPVGPTTNTFVATDSAGNQDTCSFTVYRGVDPDQADAGVDFGLCLISSSNLNAVQPTIGMGTWSSLGPAIVLDPNQFNTPVNDLILGNNRFVWTVSDGSCPTNSDTVNILVSSKPTAAEAGPDASLCDQSEFQLSANEPTVGNGYWTTDLDATFSDSMAHDARLLNFIGQGVFTWNIKSGACPISSDDVFIEIGSAPIIDAGPELYTQGQARVQVTVEVNQPTSVVWEPAVLMDDYDRLTTYANIEKTTELIVTGTSAPFCTSQDTLTIRVLSPLEINTVFTPDGDNINDVWNIEGSESYPKMKVFVFNRWGAKVFESNEGYTNKFDGKYNGNLLPVSSYYYLIEFNDGITKSRDGNLTIIY